MLALLFAAGIMALTAWLVQRFVLGTARQPGWAYPVYGNDRRHLRARGRLRR